jgi:hypothetical protein
MVAGWSSPAQPMAFLTSIIPAAPLNTVKGNRRRSSSEGCSQHRDPGNLKLTSALRMNATFPYITPVVSLPSEPMMRVMDAGCATTTAIGPPQLPHTFREWISREHQRRGGPATARYPEGTGGETQQRIARRALASTRWAVCMTTWCGCRTRTTTSCCARPARGRTSPWRSIDIQLRHDDERADLLELAPHRS